MGVVGGKTTQMDTSLAQGGVQHASSPLGHGSQTVQPFAQTRRVTAENYPRHPLPDALEGPYRYPSKDRHAPDYIHMSNVWLVKVGPVIVWPRPCGS